MTKTERIRPKLSCGPSKVIKDPTAVTDINEIIRRSQISGQLVNPRDINTNRQAIYGDFSTGSDFEEANLKIAQVNQDFATLPSKVREQFNNDPKNLLDAIADPDPEIIEALAEIGIQSAHELPPVQEPTPVVDPVDPEPVPE